MSEIRKANRSDAGGIARVHVETWRVAYRGQLLDSFLAGLSAEKSAEFWQAHVVKPENTVLVAEDGGSIIGFCNLIRTRDKDMDPALTGEIAAFYVSPTHWRRGIGRQLIQSVLAEAQNRAFQNVTLWVLISNMSARLFYEAMGFAPDGARKLDHTSDGSELNEIRYRAALTN